MEISDILIIGRDILATTVDSKTKAIIAQIGDAKAKITEHARAFVMQQVGLVSRPSNPVPGQEAAQCVAVKTGSTPTIIATTDERGRELAGSIGPGETAVYAAGADGESQGRIVIKNDGAINIVTTDDNSSSGANVMFRVAPDELLFVAPWGSLKFNADGFFLRAGDASISAGTISGVPAPLAAFTSFVKLEAMTVHCSGATTLLGAGSVHNSCGYGPVASAPAPVITGLSSFSVRCAP